MSLLVFLFTLALNVRGAKNAILWIDDPARVERRSISGVRNRHGSVRWLPTSGLCEATFDIPTPSAWSTFRMVESLGGAE